MSETDEKNQKLEILKMQIAESVDVYKHHQELFLKWIGLYGAVVAAVSVYLFHTELTAAAKHFIPILISLGTVPVILGSTGMFFWMSLLEKRFKEMSEECGVAPSPFFIGRYLILFMTFILLGAFLLCWFAYIYFDTFFK